MDELPGSTTLARGLLALHRAEATGVVTVRGSGGIAKLLVIEGTARAIQIPGDDESLGELLSRVGKLDLVAHGRALVGEEPRGLIGRWLVRHGAASEAAVSEALRNQLRQRVIGLFRWRDLELAFSASADWEGGPPLDQPVLPTELVLDAFLDAADSLSMEEASRRIGKGRLVLTRVGEAIAKRAALGAAEARLMHHLKLGSEAQELVAGSENARRALSFLMALKALGAVTRPSATARSYQALIRKQRQLRDCARSAALLDLPARATSSDAHRSLRRLARDLHPDRFPEPELRRASNDVLSQLVQAKLTFDKR